MQTTIHRLELNRVVGNAVSELGEDSRAAAMIRQRSNCHGDLSNSAFYNNILRRAGQSEFITKFHPKLRGCVAKSMVIALAQAHNIKLPESYKLGPVHKACIEELCKDKPKFDGASIHAEVKVASPLKSIPVDIKLSPEQKSVAESFGLLSNSPMKSIPISSGFRTDGVSDTASFPVSTLDAAKLKEGHPALAAIKKKIKCMKAFHAGHSTIRKSVFENLCAWVVDTSDYKFPDTPQGAQQIRHEALDKFEELMEDNEQATKTFGRSIQNMHQMDLADLERRIYSMSYPNLNTATGESLDQLAELTATEKPMRDLTITKPIMVGDINILEASEATLAMLIREAQDQIEHNKDLAAVSAKYAKKQKTLEATITVLVKQLDKA